MSDNVTIVIDRVSDLIDGLGGVSGILLTIGSIFADKFADKIPAFFSSIL
jgi:hypothetical protein